MGNVHNWYSKSSYLTPNDVTNIKKLIEGANKEFGVKLYEDIDFATVGPGNESRLLGYGEPTVHTARVAFAAKGQGNVNIGFGPTQVSSDFIHTQSEDEESSHEADMLTGSILLYLASQDKIEYHAAGITSAAPVSDNPEDPMYIYVDEDIVDSFVFGEHILGKGAMGNLEGLALEQQSEWAAEWSGVIYDIPETTLNYESSANAVKLPAASRQDKWAGKSEAGRCGAWMPRANESCVLIAAHSGPHRSR